MKNNKRNKREAMLVQKFNIFYFNNKGGKTENIDNTCVCDFIPDFNAWNF